MTDSSCVFKFHCLCRIFLSKSFKDWPAVVVNVQIDAVWEKLSDNYFVLFIGLWVLFQANYKQSRAYAVKYGAALSRALGMVRSHVRGTLENLTAQAGEQVMKQLF